MAAAWLAGARGFSGAGVSQIDSAAFSISGTNKWLRTHVGSGSSTPIIPTSVVLDPTGVNEALSAGTPDQESGIFDTFFRAGVWSKIAPSNVTSKVVRATFASAQDEVHLIPDVFTGVNQSTPTRTLPAINTGTGTAASMSITSVSGDLVISSVMYATINTNVGTVSSATLTVREKIDNADTNSAEASGTGDTTASGTSTTASFALSAGTAVNFRQFGAAIIPAGAGTSPVITDVNTTEVITSDQIGVNFTGTDLGATTGDRTIEMTDGATVQAQTQTAGNSTSGTVTIVQGNLRFGVRPFRANVGGDTGTALNVTMNPPSGELFIDLNTIAATGAITAVGPLAVGDELHARGVGGGAAPTGLTLQDDGTFFFTSGNSPAPFEVRVWDATDRTWGAFAYQDISALGFVPSSADFPKMLLAGA